MMHRTILLAMTAIAGVRDFPLAMSPLRARAADRLPPPEPGDHHSTGPIFEQDWWFDAATDGRWARAEVVWDERLVGSMPYAPTRHFGLSYLEMPAYTRVVAPRIMPPPSSATRRRENQVKIARELMAKLPPHHRLEFTLPPDGEHVYPFVQLGYRATTTYTFRVPAGANLEAAWTAMDRRTRNHVAAARRRFAIERHHDIERLVRLAERQWQGRDHHDYPALRRLFAAAAARGQAVILSAVDLDHGGDRAATALVWDDANLYHWVAARASEGETNASSLLMWEALTHAMHLGRTFDADGYDSWAAAQFLSRFGFEPTVRPVINGGSPLWRALYWARTTARPDRIDQHFRC